MPENAY